MSPASIERREAIGRFAQRLYQRAAEQGFPEGWRPPAGVQAAANGLRGGLLGHDGAVTLNAATAYEIGDLLERLVQCWDVLPEYVQSGTLQVAHFYEGARR